MTQKNTSKGQLGEDALLPLWLREAQNAYS